MCASQSSRTTMDQGEQRFYDAACLLSIDPKVAGQYYLLLGGYPTAHSKDAESPDELDRGALNLAFSALTEGNVIDACFGLKQHGSSRNARAVRSTELAKEALSQAVRSDEDVRTIAVTSYRNAFQEVLDYSEHMEHQSCCACCQTTSKVFQDAQENIKRGFLPLTTKLRSIG